MSFNLIHVILLLNMLFRKCFQDAIYPFIFGCNEYFKTSSTFNPYGASFNFNNISYFEKSICANASSYILEPFQINPILNGQVISDICVTKDNTVIVTSGNNKNDTIYAIGARSGIVNENEILAPIFRKIVDDIDFDGMGCGMDMAYIWKWDSFKYQKILYSWGRNLNGQLGVGNFEKVFTPTLVTKKFSLMKSDVWVSILTDNIKIKTVGNNFFHQLGRDVEKNEKISIFTDITMGEMEVEESKSKIKMIVVGQKAVYVVWKDSLTGYERLYFWGDNSFKMVGEIGIPMYTREPFQCDRFFAPYSDIPISTEIIQLRMFIYSAFALVNINGKNKVYSWGAYLAEKTVYTARDFDTNTWSIPVEINYGEIQKNEQIIFINNGYHVTFLLTDSNRIYAFGSNVNGGFNFDEVPFGKGIESVVLHPKRVLKEIKAPANTKRVTMQELGHVSHFLVVYHSEKDLLLVFLIIIGGFVSCVIVIAVFIISIFVVVMFILYRNYVKNMKNEIKVQKKNENSVEIELFLKFSNSESEGSSFIQSWIGENSSFTSKINIISFDQLKLTKYLAAGGSGASVFLSEYKTAKGEIKTVAFKSFPILFEKTKELLSSKNEVYEDFKRELLIYLRTSHPFILQLHGLVFQEKYIGLVNEFCELGDLKSFLMQNKMLSISAKFEILYKICSGMAHLHFNDIIHRDLKLQNILIDRNYNPKIMDCMAE